MRYIFSSHNAPLFSFFFFFNDTATTEIYTLSLHDALPISRDQYENRHMIEALENILPARRERLPVIDGAGGVEQDQADRKSTRLNSSHGYISYAVFCLKKKKKTNRRVY